MSDRHVTRLNATLTRTLRSARHLALALGAFALVLLGVIVHQPSASANMADSYTAVFCDQVDGSTDHSKAGIHRGGCTMLGSCIAILSPSASSATRLTSNANPSSIKDRTTGINTPPLVRPPIIRI
jgi:hypothetical protein